MDYQQAIESYFADQEEALVRAVSRLCAIRSVKEPAQPGMPFGPGPARCLDEALAMAREMGLTASNYDGYVGTADLNDQDTALHILGHLDVVGEGTGWTVTEPYEPKVVDGLLYGRGVSDDKGPMAAVLLAMKAVKDLGVPLKHNARVILGTDEESGSSDIAYYYGKEPYAPCTFSPDADFPVINIEKGQYSPIITKQWEPETVTPRVTSFRGGLRQNVVPPQAEAVVEGMGIQMVYPIAAQVRAKTGVEFRIQPKGTGVRIQAIGKAAHAMEPDKGRNAITALLLLLGVLPLAQCESTEALRSLYELLPYKDTKGEALGIAQQDEASGELTVTLALLEITETGMEGRFDCRTPLCANRDNCQTAAEAAFAGKGLTCTGDMTAPHHTPAGTPFVQALLKCYEQYTGQPGECLSTGGATYVHNIPGGVAFGPVMPGFQTNLHGPDERIPVADLLTASKIFTQVIIDLCS